MMFTAHLRDENSRIGDGTCASRLRRGSHAGDGQGVVGMGEGRGEGGVMDERGYY